MLALDKFERRQLLRGFRQGAHLFKTLQTRVCFKHAGGLVELLQEVRTGRHSRSFPKCLLLSQHRRIRVCHNLTLALGSLLGSRLLALLLLGQVHCEEILQGRLLRVGLVGRVNLVHQQGVFLDFLIKKQTNALDLESQLVILKTNVVQAIFERTDQGLLFLTALLGGFAVL